MNVKLKKSLWIAAATAVVLYIVSFAVLALDGGYIWVMSGHFRPMGLLASPDMLVWQPQHGTFYPFRRAGGDDSYEADLLGWFYSPLILLHQHVFAPSIRLVQPDGSVAVPSPRLPDRDQLHPEFLAEWEDAEKSFGITWEQMQEQLQEQAASGSGAAR